MAVPLNLGIAFLLVCLAALRRPSISTRTDGCS